MLQSVDAYTPDIQGNECTESTNSMYIWPLVHCTWFNSAYPFLLQSPAWLWAINTCTLRGGSIIFTGSKPWSEMKKIRYTILLDIYSCCNPIYLNIYQSYWGFSGNNSLSNLYLLPEHLILGIQTASYNLPYKHGVLKKKRQCWKSRYCGIYNWTFNIQIIKINDEYNEGKKWKL